jgi:GMP synthase-like glutamine amidotransferase
MSNCLVVQHVVPESAFAIADALRDAGVSVGLCRVFAGDTLPSELAGLDGLVVMGGPMSAASDQGFPTRRAEIALLAGAIAAGLPTLGVCLGAQLLARAGGGSVSTGADGPEIGWDRVSLSAGCQSDPLFSGLPQALTVLQWHGETFELPPGGRRLISNAKYANQAYRIGDAAWGMQFHLEVTQEAVDGFLTAFGADTQGIPGGAERIRKATPAALDALSGSRDLVLSRFAGLVAAGVSRADLVGLG